MNYINKMLESKNIAIFSMALADQFVPLLDTAYEFSLFPHRPDEVFFGEYHDR
tara:strand:- start:421 stop:579 length:159 start_codon:yes stop_codon:yes gene_type:complete